MFDQEGVHEIYREWHRVLAEYDGDRALVAEAWVEPIERLARYVRPDEMHQAFNFAFLTTTWDAPSLRRVVTASLTASDAVGAPTTWVAVQPRHRAAHVAAGSGPGQRAAQRHRPRRRAARRGTRPAPGTRGVAHHAGTAGIGLPLPGRGARPARAHGARRRPATGPRVVALGAQRTRSRRLPSAAAVGEGRARVRLLGDRRDVAAAARLVGRLCARRAARASRVPRTRPTARRSRCAHSSGSAPGHWPGPAGLPRIDDQGTCRVRQLRRARGSPISAPVRRRCPDGAVVLHASGKLAPSRGTTFRALRHHGCGPACELSLLTR